jgi:4-aminobutyrate aminotransferase-like enzyme
MKKRVVKINVFIGMMVLFSILFQSFHGIEHLTKQLSEKKCTHKHFSGEEITHQHHNFDYCLVCEVIFSSCINSEKFTFQYQYVFLEVSYSEFFSENVTSFSGSNYSLRGPPQFIV